MGKLDGKVALLTGSSPNIVGGIAEGLADEGAKIVAVDIFSGFANGCAEAINERGGEAVGLVCDVTSEEQVQATVEQAAPSFRRHRHTRQRRGHLQLGWRGGYARGAVASPA